MCGVANGVYLAMDQAIAVDTLPSGEEAARYLGVWGIGCFLGASLGPVIGGPILSLCGRSLDGSYNYSGYVVILLLAAGAFLGSGVLLRFLRESGELELFLLPWRLHLSLYSLRENRFH